jgi:hypothetical protein
MTRVGTLLDLFQGQLGVKSRRGHGSDIPDAESVKGKRIVLAVLGEFCVG